MTRPTYAYINLNHLQHNYSIAKELSSNQSNAYGHNALLCAQALSHCDGFAVACVDEALEIRNQHKNTPIVVLQGPYNIEEWQHIYNNNLQCVVHDFSQLLTLTQFLENYLEETFTRKINIWIKFNTGMNRLGFEPNQKSRVVSELKRLNITPQIMMTHFSCAGTPNSPVTEHQLQTFYFTATDSTPFSFNNSAAILEQVAQDEISRAGIMLYGSSPIIGKTAQSLNLKPVMKLTSQVIALHDIKKGAYVGYGQEWQAKSSGKIAVIAIGYGDGYPRQAPIGTPVAINGEFYSLSGRVSMDMICVFSPTTSNIKVGDLVELWGDMIDIDDIARLCNTISYELMCSITSRVIRKEVKTQI
jgi:alanine racemase